MQAPVRRRLRLAADHRFGGNVPAEVRPPAPLEADLLDRRVGPRHGLGERRGDAGDRKHPPSAGEEPMFFLTPS